MKIDLRMVAKRHKRFPPGKSSNAPVWLIQLFYWFSLVKGQRLYVADGGHLLFDVMSLEVVFVVVSRQGEGVGRSLLDKLPFGSWARTDESRAFFYTRCGWERLDGQKRFMKVEVGRR